MYLVSACLAGINCKYNGKSNCNEKIIQLVKDRKAILVCPEQLGGLTTPREACEIIQDNKDKIGVINKSGKDVTANFTKGAEETLNIAMLYSVKKAILKAGSPSCGCGWIYDGSFTGNKIKGNGLTVQLLLKHGIKIYTEEALPEEL